MNAENKAQNKLIVHDSTAQQVLSEGYAIKLRGKPIALLTYDDLVDLDYVINHREILYSLRPLPEMELSRDGKYILNLIRSPIRVRRRKEFHPRYHRTPGKAQLFRNIRDQQVIIEQIRNYTKAIQKERTIEIDPIEELNNLLDIDY